VVMQIIKYNHTLVIILAVFITLILSCREKKNPLFLDCFEYKSEKLQNKYILNAQWSPKGDKMLILTRDLKEPSSKNIYCFYIHYTTDDSFEKVLSLSSEDFEIFRAPRWISDSCFIFFCYYHINPKRKRGYQTINKFNISTNETTIAYEDENFFFLTDALDDDILIIKVPDEHILFSHAFPHSQGVLSLFKMSLKNAGKTERLSSLYPDTLLHLSAVNSARFISKNKLVLEKCIVETFAPDTAKDPNIYRRLELLNLANNSSQFLKEYKFPIEDSGGTGFEVSPSGKWVIYSSFSYPKYYPPYGDTLKLLSITNSKTEKSLVFRRNYGNKVPFSYRKFAFWVLDWSPEGNKILVLRENRKTQERKLFIVELHERIIR